ncbi:MAG TPA: phage GP46 family protein [Nevskiaceae bacterium]|nr:phage GP46 family protein [Nevskiaceae bacterium]
MTDFALEPTGNGNALDIVLFDGDAVADDSLRASVLVSLFSDRRATAEQLAEAGLSPDDRRGSWTDTFAADGDRQGSLLWLLARERQTDKTLRRAREYAEDALRWLVSDAIASSVTVTAAWIGDGFLDLGVSIESTGGTLKLRYALLWANSAIDPLAGPNRIAGAAAQLAQQFDFIWYQQVPGVTLV